MRNIWKDGVFGVVTGDALGCPVQFKDRKEIAKDPVTTEPSPLVIMQVHRVARKGGSPMIEIRTPFASPIPAPNRIATRIATPVGTL